MKFANNCYVGHQFNQRSPGHKDLMTLRLCCGNACKRRQLRCKHTDEQTQSSNNYPCQKCSNNMQNRNVDEPSSICHHTCQSDTGAMGYKNQDELDPKHRPSFEACSGQLEAQNQVEKLLNMRSCKCSLDKREKWSQVLI